MTSSEQGGNTLASGIQGMIRIPGGTFRMGSDRHYPEEAPVHCVTVDGFLIDRTPVTNRQEGVRSRDRGRLVFAEARGGCGEGVLHPEIRTRA